MIDEVSDVLGWNRKHAIKALNGKASLGQKARRRGSKATYSEAETAVIVGIWKHSEQPCGTRLMHGFPAVTTGHDMVNRPRILKTSLSCHAPTQLHSVQTSIFLCHCGD